MKKHLNEKYEVILYSDLQPMRDVDKPYPKNGELVNHREIVYEIKYRYIGSQDIILPKDFIVDLYNQIQKIEENIVLKKKEPDLPF